METKENLIEMGKDSEECLVGMGVERVVEELMEKHYRDVSREDVVFDIYFEGNDVDLRVVLGEDNVASVRGNLPNELVYRNDFDVIFRGLLGHELAHVVRGDHSMGELEGDLYCVGLDGVESRRVYLPVVIDEIKLGLFGNKKFAEIERAADREAICRGLGREIYESLRYCEYTAQINGRILHPGYYTSKDVLKIIERNV